MPEITVLSLSLFVLGVVCVFMAFKGVRSAYTGSSLILAGIFAATGIVNSPTIAVIYAISISIALQLYGVRAKRLISECNKKNVAKATLDELKGIMFTADHRIDEISGCFTWNNELIVARTPSAMKILVGEQFKVVEFINGLVFVERLA